jgi:uncharacterized membrane protein
MDPVVAARQGFFSLIAGVVFGAGWWAFFDGIGYGVAFANDDASRAAQGYAWLPLFGATIAFVMINAMMWSELRDNERAPTVAAKARIFLLVALFVMMASIAGAAFIMVDKFLARNGTYQWAGISVLVGTLLVSLATFVMRFGTVPVGVENM